MLGAISLLRRPDDVESCKMSIAPYTTTFDLYALATVRYATLPLWSAGTSFDNVHQILHLTRCIASKCGKETTCRGNLNEVVALNDVRPHTQGLPVGSGRSVELSTKRAPRVLPNCGQNCICQSCP